VASSKKPNAGKVHISINEKVAKSICAIGYWDTWNGHKSIPNTSDKLADVIPLNSNEAARCLKYAYSSARPLMTIREQVDWLDSRYNFSCRDCWRDNNHSQIFARQRVVSPMFRRPF